MSSPRGVARTRTRTLAPYWAVQFVTEQADGKLEVTSSKSWPGDESKSPPPSNPARKGYR